MEHTLFFSLAPPKNTSQFTPHPLGKIDLNLADFTENFEQISEYLTWTCEVPKRFVWQNILTAKHLGAQVHVLTLFPPS